MKSRGCMNCGSDHPLYSCVADEPEEHSLAQERAVQTEMRYGLTMNEPNEEGKRRGLALDASVQVQLFKASPRTWPGVIERFDSGGDPIILLEGSGESVPYHTRFVFRV